MHVVVFWGAFVLLMLAFSRSVQAQAALTRLLAPEEVELDAPREDAGLDTNPSVTRESA